MYFQLCVQYKYVREIGSNVLSLYIVYYKSVGKMFSNGLSLLTLVETGDALGAFPAICMLVLYFDDDVNTSLLVFWNRGE